MIDNSKTQGAEAVEVVTSSKRIPYALLTQELEGSSSDFVVEMNEINKFYQVYREGSKFTTEGSLGDYIPSQVRFKKAAQLINKEARFMFGEAPKFVVSAKGDLGEQSKDYKDAMTVYGDIIDTVMQDNMFQKIVLQSARDCFIGKRVACMVNFSEESGITVTFHDSRSFIYELDANNMDKLTKFVCFVVWKNSSSLRDKRIFKKKFELVDGIVYVEEIMYDGRGKEIEVVMEYQATKLTNIPCVVILNDGLLSDDKGESEIEDLDALESVFSKMNNADIDAERKGMNQIKYAVDMDTESTSKISTSPGSFWDLQSNQNLDKPAPSVGTLQCSMEYSGALATTLKRIETEMYNELEMPMIDIQTMSGIITSGKALKAVYWPLIVRCKEKMKTWAPKMEYIARSIIEGCIAYPNIAKMYTVDTVQLIDYIVKVEYTFPLPEDIDDQKNMDLAEVQAQTMSRMAYMKKWRDMTDDDAMAELEQIALERQMLEEGYADEGGSFEGSLGAKKTIEEEETEVDAEEEMNKEKQKETQE